MSALSAVRRRETDLGLSQRATTERCRNGDL
jgi:hypothetical protein